MAERRMFAKSVIESDAFSNLSTGARLLYFYIGLHADDDGFSGQVQRTARSEGIEASCIAELVSAGFLYQFDSGAYLVRHWNVNNTLQKDRYHETNYQSEKATVILNKNKIWELLQTGNKLESECFQDVSKMEPENSIDKNSIDENRLEKYSKDKARLIQRSIGESGESVLRTETRGKTRAEIIAELKSAGIELSDANPLVNRYGEETIEQRLTEWTLAGRQGTFRGFLLDKERS